MSESPFIAFLDADDEWLPEKLEKQISLLKRDPALGMVCSHCSISEPGSEWRAIFSQDGVPASGNLFARLVRDCFVFTPSVVVRRQCLDEVGLFNEHLSVSEDLNLWLRIAARWKIALQPEVLVIVRRRPGSLSTNVSVEEQLRNGVLALEHARDTCRDLRGAEARALRHAIAQRRYLYGSHLLATGAAQDSRNHFAAALSLQPSHWKALAKLGLSFFPDPLPEVLARYEAQSCVWAASRGGGAIGPDQSLTH